MAAAAEHDNVKIAPEVRHAPDSSSPVHVVTVRRWSRAGQYSQAANGELATGAEQDPAIAVAIDLDPARGLEAIREGPAVASNDDDRDAPIRELGLPSIDAGDHRLVLGPDRRREELDARVDRDGQRRQGVLEPRSPRLRRE